MSTHLSCIIARSLTRRHNSFGVLRSQTPRWLCSSADKSGEPKTSSAEESSREQAEAMGDGVSDTTVSTRSANVLEAVRNFKPPNADEFSMQNSQHETSLDYPGGNFSKSMAYQMSVKEALGISKEELAMHNRSIRMRMAIYTTICTIMFYLLFLLPGEEEIDEVTGDVYRQQPGYVDLINDLRALYAYLSGSKKKPEQYVWTPS